MQILVSFFCVHDVSAETQSCYIGSSIVRQNVAPRQGKTSMNKAGHHITSAALAMAAWPALSAQDPLSGAVAATGMLVGASAPDWLEGVVWLGDKRLSLLPHRTLTHWPVLWLICAVLTAIIWSGYTRTLGLGFIAGSLLHIAMDLGTPTGIPLLLPFGQRTTARLYTAGTLREGVLIGAWCLLCFGIFALTT